MYYIKKKLIQNLTNYCFFFFLYPSVHQNLILQVFMARIEGRHEEPVSGGRHEEDFNNTT